ncbi:hypothetical protein [Consotaella aegiceratis]|uniref:hypothetical protein n=1 Tax=Consotaella aegiceratis TaxID=3097961 RepID=UPI002F3F4407
MSPRMIILESIAVLVGAVIGKLVGDVAAWLFVGESLFMLLASVGRYLVALITVALFAVLYAKLPPTPAALASFFVGVLVPALFAKIALGTLASWPAALLLGVVFSLVALLTYRLVHANARVRSLAAEAPEDF